MRILSIIPARGGSKGVPKKNIRNLNGEPLISYSIKASQNSLLVNDTVVSTDDEAIAKVSEYFGAEVIKRPSELAQDQSLVIDAMRQVIRVKEEMGTYYDYVVLIEPTSPLRTPDDIDSTIQLVIDKGADSGATFSETPTPPNRVWKIEDFSPQPFIQGANPFLPRQVQEKGYFLNGMVYVVKVSELMKDESSSVLLGKQVASIIPSSRVIDIDTLEDFRMAEFKISKNNNE